MSERISMADKIAIGLSVAALVVSVVAVALPYRTVHHLRATVVRAGWFDGDGMQFDGDVIISNSGSVDEVVLSVQLLMSANLETRHSTVLGTVHGPFVVKPGTAVPIRLAHTLQGDILLEAGAVTDAAVVIEYGVEFTVLTPEARAAKPVPRGRFSLRPGLRLSRRPGVPPKARALHGSVDGP